MLLHTKLSCQTPWKWTAPRIFGRMQSEKQRLEGLEDLEGLEGLRVLK